MKEHLRILLADDHAVVRRGLKQIVAEQWPLVHCGEAGTAQQTLDLVRQEPWDLVLLDLAMPGRGGLEVLQEIKKEHPRLPILVLSGQPEEHYGIRVLRAGGSGYLQKESAPDMLVNAVRKALRGEHVLSPALADKMVLELAGGQGESAHEMLSDREFQVLRMIGAGKTVSHIAAELNLNDKTISTYRSRILEKLKLSNNAELMRYCVDHRID